jgi:hypothetical protein
MTKIAGSGSISQRHGSADPDPPQNVMDPQHCFVDQAEPNLLFDAPYTKPSGIILNNCFCILS